jgi:hypothetical protein
MKPKFSPVCFVKLYEEEVSGFREKAGDTELTCGPATIATENCASEVK